MIHVKHEEVAMDTLAGKLLTESVDRLAQTISAAKAHSDRLKAESLGAPTTPVTLQEVDRGSGSGDQQTAP